MLAAASRNLGIPPHLLVHAANVEVLSDPGKAATESKKHQLLLLHVKDPKHAQMHPLPTPQVYLNDLLFNSAASFS